jgi:hypothetical protein
MQRLSIPVRIVPKMMAPQLRRGLLAPLVAVSLLLVVRPARAQSAASGEAQALSDCLAGRYQAGVDQLARLFVETGNANYIYNQGRCFEQNGKPDEAILRFREFLRKGKDISNEEKAEVNGHIAECQAMQAERDNRRAPAAATIAPPLEALAPAQPQPVPAALAAPPDKPMAATPAVDQPGAGLRTAGIVAGSIGVAALITGIIFSIETRSIANQVSNDDAKFTYSRTKDDRGKLFSDLQWVGYGVAAGALAAGSVLTYLGWRAAHPSAAVSLSPVLLPGGSGAVVQGSF